MRLRFLLLAAVGVWPRSPLARGDLAAWRRCGGRLMATVWFFLMSSGMVEAAEEGSRKVFDVPAGAAEKALKLFSEQSGRGIVFVTATVKDVQTAAVKGELTPREALDRLLADTALHAVEDEKSGAFTLRKRESATSDPRRRTAPPEGAGAPRPDSSSPGKPLSDQAVGPASRPGVLSPDSPFDIPKEPTKTMKRKSPLALLTGWLALTLGSSQLAHAADGVPADFPPSVGSIVGRISNASTGNYLNNAHVSVRGSLLEAYSNEIGEYRLLNVPAGDVTIHVQFVGLGTHTATVRVAPGQTVNHDVDLSVARRGTGVASDVIELEAFTVEDREMSGQAVALHEQKNAPNIKNVVSMDEFGDMGEGNIGEFLKFVPGLDIQNNPATPQYVTVRGMPSSGTLVMVDGVAAASSSANDSRQFDLSTAATGNVDRMEITKTPTPDMPANAVGGSINVVSRSGFSRKSPLLSYNLFLTYNELGGIEDFRPRLGKAAGPDPKSTDRYIQPAVNLSYILPVNRSLAFTFAASYAPRRGEMEYLSSTWDRVGLVQTANRMNNILTLATPRMASGAVDWKVSDHGVLRLSFLHSHRFNYTRQNIIVSTLGANATGGPEFSQGASAGVGSVVQNFNLTSNVRHLNHATLSYRHEGDRWKFDANAAYSTGGFTRKDMEEGFFSGITTSNPNLVVRLDGLGGIGDRRVPRVAAVNRAGAPVDVFDGNTNSITAVAGDPIRIKNDIIRAAFNLSRELSLAYPVTLKTGFVYDLQTRDVIGGARSYTFNPPGGAAGRLAANFDFIAPEYSDRWYFTDTYGSKVKPRWLSSAKVYDLYRTNPEWFALNESQAHINAVNASRRLEEAITAAYLRADVKLFENRLWIVAGVRFERTVDEGWGAQNDVSGTYVRNPDGTFARDEAGRLIPITTNAVERAKLQYTERGTHIKKSYDGYYPSVNASYNLSSEIVLRAAYARTIGRPNLNEIIPRTTITDPDAETTNKTITVINSGLLPWTANNYDVTLEAYNLKGAVASVSLFQKDIENFFATDRREATAELLEEFEIPWEYLEYGYDIVTKRNAGAASLRGVEISYRQSLSVLGRWGKRFQLFGNLTSMALSGANAADFSEFSPRNINWGVSYATPRFIAKINVSSNKWVRRSVAAVNATTLPGTYTYRLPQTRVDLSAEYRLSKKLTLYGSVRNLFASPLRTATYNSDTPEYARPNNYQFIQALFTLGIKGNF